MRYLLAALIVFAAGAIVGVRTIEPWLRRRWSWLATRIFGR